MRGFIDATVTEGFSRVTDFNGPKPSGVGAYPVNVIDGVRQNVGLVYLTAEVRKRPNLTIQGDVLVDRVLFDGGQAVGSPTTDGAEIEAGEVILSSGTYSSPATCCARVSVRRPPRRPWHRTGSRPTRRPAPARSALLLQRLRPEARCA